MNGEQLAPRRREVTLDRPDQGSAHAVVVVGGRDRNQVQLCGLREVSPDQRDPDHLTVDDGKVTRKLSGITDIANYGVLDAEPIRKGSKDSVDCTRIASLLHFYGHCAFVPS